MSAGGPDSQRGPIASRREYTRSIHALSDTGAPVLRTM